MATETSRAAVAYRRYAAAAPHSRETHLDRRRRADRRRAGDAAARRIPGGSGGHVPGAGQDHQRPDSAAGRVAGLQERRRRRRRDLDGNRRHLSAPSSSPARITCPWRSADSRRWSATSRVDADTVRPDDGPAADAACRGRRGPPAQRRIRRAAGAAGGANGTQPFEAIAVQQQAAGALVAETAAEREAEESAARQLLPPGFSTDAPDAGGGDHRQHGQPRSRHARRSLRGDRTRRVRSGDRRAAARVRHPGAPGGQPGGFGPDGFGGPGGRGGPGGPGGPGGRGGPGGAGGPRRAGRARRLRARRTRRTAERLQRPPPTTPSADRRSTARPYQLRPDSPPDARPTPARTSAAPSAARSRSPASTTARAGPTSRSPTTATAATSCSISTPPCRPTRCAPATSRRRRRQLIDPRTGLPFAGNQIPPDALSPTSLALLRYIPSPNLPARRRNFHYTTTTDSSATTSACAHAQLHAAAAGPRRAAGAAASAADAVDRAAAADAASRARA